jgi:hypothetical protein
MLKRLLRFLNKDLTGRTWVAETTHPYFGHMVYFGNKDQSRAFWEVSDLPAAGTDAGVSVFLSGTPNGPTAEEEDFCRDLLAARSVLIDQCLPLVAADIKERQGGASSSSVSEMRLEGFDVPKSGNRSNPWEATFSVPGRDGLFTVEFDNGKPNGVRFDD